MKLFRAALLVCFVPFLVHCSFIAASAGDSSSCHYNSSDLKMIPGELPELIDNFRWYRFPEGANIMPDARATLEPYSDEFRRRFKFAEKVIFGGKNLIVTISRQYNQIEIITGGDFTTEKTLPIRFYGHYLYAKEWETENGEFLVIYVDLKATKNLSMLFVLDKNLNLLFRDCFSRPIALGFGESHALGDIFAVKYRPNETTYFYWDNRHSGQTQNLKIE